MDVGIVFMVIWRKYFWVRETPTSLKPLLTTTHLSDRRRQQVDDPLVGDRDHALAVDLDDPVPHPDASPLGDAAAQEAADLEGEEDDKRATYTYVYTRVRHGRASRQMSFVFRRYASSAVQCSAHGGGCGVCNYGRWELDFRIRRGLLEEESTNGGRGNQEVHFFTGGATLEM